MDLITTLIIRLLNKSYKRKIYLLNAAPSVDNVYPGNVVGLRFTGLSNASPAFRCDIRTTRCRHLPCASPSVPSLSQLSSVITIRLPRQLLDLAYSNMSYHNLDLDQFLPLASETIGYDFSSLARISPRLATGGHANDAL